MNLLRGALAEAIGTFAFLTIGFLTLVAATAIGQGSTLVILLTVPFGFGLGLFAAISMFGHVSGGHSIGGDVGCPARRRSASPTRSSTSSPS
jgi:glycerol uptake facilitator-like aquaporin